MRFLAFIIIVVSVLLWRDCYSQTNIYTWKDKNGVLNITDVPPPSDAEILDVSPSHREQALEINRQRRMILEQIEQEEREKRLQRQAAEESKRKAAAYDEASRLLEEAEYMREGVEGGMRKKRRYERRAERLEQQAEKIIENPELIEKKEKPARKRSGY